jgi:creatinine amidohydrolase
MALADRTWVEVQPRQTVLVPIGSLEQHGPHLPMDTDSVIARAVAEAVAPLVGAMVAPVVAYGASGEHQDFPGTISIGSEALAHLLVELVRSLHTWAGRVVLVNGHGGNLEAVTSAVSCLVDEGHDVSWVPCAWQGDAHAGRAETSLMLHLAPQRIRLQAAEPGNTAPLADLMPRLRAGGVRAVTPNGVLGDPTEATAAEGERLLDQMVTIATDRLTAARPGMSRRSSHA